MERYDAQALAEELVQASAEPGLTPTLIADAVRENNRYFVFPFNSREWLENDDFTKLLLTGPVVIDKETGRAWIAPGSSPVDEYISNLEDKDGIPHDGLRPLS